MALTTIELINRTFSPIAGKRLLDVGCGPGRLAHQLVEMGADVTGLDPDPEIVAAAARFATDARFVEGSAENLPFDTESFDGVVFLNSLHHVPQPGMAAALREAGRVLRRGGHLVVVEPLLTGNFVPVLGIVDDESEVRTAAQIALDSVGGDSGLSLQSRDEFNRRETFADLDDFAARIIQADAARAPLIDRRRAELQAAWERWAEKTAEGYALDQPLRAHVFRKTA